MAGYRYPKSLSMAAFWGAPDTRSPSKPSVSDCLSPVKLSPSVVTWNFFSGLVIIAFKFGDRSKDPTDREE